MRERANEDDAQSGRAEEKGLSRLDYKTRRREVERAAQHESKSSTRYVNTVAVSIGVLVVGGMLLAKLGSIVGVSEILIVSLVFPLGVFLIARYIWKFEKRCRMKWRQQYLICPKCEYDLIGISPDRCPECGEPIPGRGNP